MRRLWRLVGVAVGVGVVVALFVVARSGVKVVAPPAMISNLAPEQIRPEPKPDDWPCWRGATSNGIATGFAPFVNWNTSERIRWSVPIPGRGHASPCVWGSRIFIATADDAAQIQSMLCFDRATGAPLWKTDVHQGGFISKHDKNSHASATPACDGVNVYIPFAREGAVWVSALDLNGKIVWQTEAGALVTKWGYGSSPVLSGSLIIVAGDNRGSGLDRLMGSSFLAALDCRTGKVVWRIKRQGGDSYGTPILGEVAGKQQLLLAGKHYVSSYDPATGKQYWTCEWEANRTAGTMAFAGDLVYASAQHDDHELICIRADGSGDVTKTHVVWRGSKGAADIPSPLCHENMLYVVSDNGILTCFEADTGKTVWKHRLGGNFTASLVAGGGYLYATNEDGKTFVIKPGPRCEVVAENSLGEAVLATPALCGNQIILRAGPMLYCLENKQVERISFEAAGQANR